MDLKRRLGMSMSVVPVLKKTETVQCYARARRRIAI